MTYKNACGLLSQKFDELKQLLSTSDTEKKFIDFLKSSPNDEVIAELFTGCWDRNFVMNSLSFQFLEMCKDRLCRDKQDPFIYEPVEEEMVNVKLCMNFVYLLHLIQSGIIQYQKENNFLYVS